MAGLAASASFVIFLVFLAPRVFPESPWAYRVHHYLMMEDSPLCFFESLESLCDSRPSGRYTFSIETKPHDCEFWSAPLGRKNCHYEKDVSGPIHVDDTNRAFAEEFFLSTDVSNADYVITVSWNRVED